MYIRFRHSLIHSIFICLMIASLLVTLVPYSALAETAPLVPDAGLDKAIRSQLKKPAGELTANDLERLTTLNAVGVKGMKGIGDLTGLQYATELNKLMLRNNKIKDLYPISGLKGLKLLDLTGNQITDVRTLSGLYKLKALFLDNNAFEDPKPLWKLTQLEQLFVSQANITDLTGIGALQKLTILDATSNPIQELGDLSKLTKLEHLFLSNAALTDIGALRSLTNLKTLYLKNNQITDISALTALPKLREVYLQGNPLAASAMDVLSELQERGVKISYDTDHFPGYRLPISVLMDDERIRFDDPPVNVDGAVLVPFRPIFEKLGLSIAWDEQAQQVKGVKDGLDIVLSIGSGQARVNGQTIALSAAPVLRNGTTFVPLRFVGEASKKEVVWNQDKQAVYVFTPVKDGFGKVYDSNGRLVYEGSFRNGKYDGQGTSYNTDGDVEYEGTWKEGSKEGRGKLYNVAHKLYKEGQFVRDDLDGFGKIYWSDGSKWIGGFKKGKPKGLGKLYDTDGRLYYVGEVDDKTLQGHGTRYYDDGSLTGQFVKGILTGSGIVRYDDGDRVEGTLNNSSILEGKYYLDASYLLFEGKFKSNNFADGTMHFPDGSTYTGTFKNQEFDSGVFKDRSGQQIKATENGTGALFYANGQLYVGEIQGSQPNGKGTYYYVKSGKVEGYFKNGKLEGESKIYNDKGTLMFEGNFAADERDGFGKEYSSEGKLQYEGEYVKGKRSGQGKSYNFQGSLVYAGGFLNGMRDGQGTAYRDGKVVYEGQFHKSQYDGEGKLTFYNGDTYTGKFEKGRYAGHDQGTFSDAAGNPLTNGAENGVGIFRYANGTMYKGEFLNDVIEGKGETYQADGKLKYSGEYKKGEWSGFGQLLDAEGHKRYEGQFENGMEQGQGKSFYPNGQLSYEGQFEDGEWSGRGKKYTESGRLLYEGEFEESDYNGVGTIYYTDGVIFKGTFEYGSLTEDGQFTDASGSIVDLNQTITGEGKLYYGWGSRYEGALVDGQPQGRGKLYDQDGKLEYEGEFDNGHPLKKEEK